MIKFIQINLQHSKAAVAAFYKMFSNSSYDVALIQEPYLFQGKVCGLQVPGSLQFCVANARAAVVAKKHVNCWLIPQLTASDVATIGVKLRKTTGEIKVIVSSLYLPYDREQMPPTKELIEVINYSIKTKLSVIIGCDANAHHQVWGSSDINDRGKALLEYAMVSNLEILNRGDRPTFVNRVREEVIDVTLVSSGVHGYITDWQVSEEVSFSDHRYIIFKLGDIQQDEVYSRNPKKTNWDIYEEDLEDVTLTGNINSKADIELAISALTEVIISSYHKACPETKAYSGSKKVPWWSNMLTKMRKKARRAFRRRRENPQFLLEYTELQRAFKKEVRKEKRKSWRAFCESIKSMSETARLQKIVNKEARCAPGMLRVGQHEYTSSPEEMLQTLLTAHFPDCRNITNCDKNNLPATEQTDASVDPDWETAANIVDNDKIRWAIEELQPFKSAGVDGVFPALLQHANDCVIEILKKIFRACIAFGYIPRLWRQVKVVFIPKPGKNTYDEAKSFRPISLTSYLLKTLEKLIYQFFRSTTLKDKPLHRLQFAYQEGRSTITALQQFVERIEENFDKKGFALAVFMDIEGAFDNVPFDSLLKTLRARSIPKAVCTIIECMLTTRMLIASSNGATKMAVAGRGCPQGGVLSPLLWNLVVDELLKNMERNAAYAFAYADDVTSMTMGKHLDIVTINMQKNLNLVERWCNETGLRVNPAKTTAVLFTKNQVTKLGSLKIFQQNINYSETVKLLGVTLDHKLLFNEHCRLVCKKATLSIMQCRRTAGKTWGLSPKAMLWIYNMVVKPIFSYSAILWWHRMKVGTIKNQLTGVQRLALLCTTGAQHSCSTAALEALLCVPPLDIFLVGQAIQAYNRLYRSRTWSCSAKNGHSNIAKFDWSSKEMVKFPKDLCCRKIFFRKNFTAEVNAGEVHGQPGYDLNCFTDGSRTQARSGAGLYIQQLELGMYWPLGEYCTVFQAEMYAIYMTAKYLLDIQVQYLSIGIFSDSQASIKALMKISTKSAIVQQCIEALNMLGYNNTVCVSWIKGHNNCAGNVLADLQAKKAARKSFVGPEPVLPVLNCTLKQAVQDWTLSQHRSRWWAGKVGNLTKRLCGEPNSRDGKVLLGFNRKSLKLTVDILTGHCSLQRHLHTLGIVDSPLCPNCGEEEEESVEHFVCKCEAFCRIRREIFGSSYLDVEVIKNKEKVKLSKYIKATSRFD